MGSKGGSGGIDDIARNISELVKDATDGSSSPDEDDLIDELERIYSEVGRLPEPSDINNKGKYSVSDYTERFGSLDEAYTKAGIDKRKDLLDELERVWKNQGEEPSKSDMNKHGKYSTDIYSDYFDSWKDAKEVLADERDVPRNVSDTELTFDDISEDGRLPEIRVLVKAVTRQRGKKDMRLKLRDVEGNSIIMYIWSKHQIQHEFERDTWYILKDARAKIWGGEDSHKRLSSTKDLEIIKDGTDTSAKTPEDDLLSDLRRLDNELNKPPSKRDIQEVGEYSVGTYENRFGSIENALKEADIDTWREKYSDKELLDEVKRVAEKLDRSPSTKDMRLHGELFDEVGKYFLAFKSWDDTLKRAELPHWKEDFDKSDLIDEILHVAEKLDKVPTKHDMKQNSGLADYYDEYFGSWTNALRAAGYDVQKRERLPDKKLIQELAELVREHGEVTEKIIERESEFHPQTYRARFGSIEEARRMTDNGQSDDESKSQGEIDSSELKEKRVGDLVRLQPTSTRELADSWDMDKKEAKRYLWSELKPYYEARSTGLHATRKAEGLVKSNSENKTSSKVWGRPTEGSSTDNDAIHNKHSDSEDSDDGGDFSSGDEASDAGNLIEDLRMVYSKIGILPDQEAIREHGNHPWWKYTYEFGSLEKAYEAAGLDVRDELIEEVERVSEKLSKEPTKEEVAEHGRLPLEKYSEHFGSWRVVLNSADTTEEEPDPEPSRSELIEELKRIYSEKGYPPLQTDINQRSEYSTQDYTDEFGSLNKAREAAGIKMEEELLKEIERVSEKLEKKPTTTDMNKHIGFGSIGMYSDYFNSWSNALEKADLVTDDPEPTQEDLKQALKSLYLERDRLPTSDDIHDGTDYSVQDYVDKFGSLNEACEAAGINVKKELINEIERVSMEIGKEPTTAEMREHVEFGLNVYYNSFDSWSDALEEADLVTDERSGLSQGKTHHSIPKDTWRGRVAQVLKTDEWKDAHDVSKEVTESEEIDKRLSKGGASSVLSDMYRNNDVIRREVSEGQTQYEYRLREDSHEKTGAKDGSENDNTGTDSTTIDKLSSLFK